MAKEASDHHDVEVAPVAVPEKLGQRVGKLLEAVNTKYQGVKEGQGSRDPEKFAWRRLGKRLDEVCEEFGLSRPRRGRRGDDPKYQDVPLAATSYNDVIAYIRSQPGSPKSKKPKRVSLAAISALLDALEHQCSGYKSKRWGVMIKHKVVMTYAEREEWQRKFEAAYLDDAFADATAEIERHRSREAARCRSEARYRQAMPEGWKPGLWAVIGPPEIRVRGEALMAEVPLADGDGQPVTAFGTSASGDWDAIRVAIQATIPDMEELENIRWYYILEGQLTSDDSSPTCRLVRADKNLTGKGKRPGTNRAAAEAIVDIANQIIAPD